MLKANSFPVYHLPFAVFPSKVFEHYKVDVEGKIAASIDSKIRLEKLLINWSCSKEKNNGRSNMKIIYLYQMDKMILCKLRKHVFQKENRSHSLFNKPYFSNWTRFPSINLIY